MSKYSDKRPPAIELPASQKPYLNHHQQLAEFFNSTLAIIAPSDTAEPPAAMT